MRIVHLVLPRASQYERKSQRIDFDALCQQHEVVLAESPRTLPSGDAAQVYGPRSLLPRMSMPFIANSLHHWRFRSRRPSILVSPVKREGFDYLPEAVGEEWFAARAATPPSSAAGEGGRRYTVGSFFRPAVASMVEQTLPRLRRTREDIDWVLLEGPPKPDDLSSFDVWVDPVTDDRDFDGFVAEALVSGKPVVASQTPINIQRLEKGRTGFLVPPGDANELTHAILTALFKVEVAQQRTEAAQQTISKFVPRQRIRVLTHMLETLRP